MERRLSDPSGGQRPFRPRGHTERGGRGGLTRCYQWATVRVCAWSRGLEAMTPVTATGRACLAQSRRVAQKWPDSAAQGSAAPGGPRRPLGPPSGRTRVRRPHPAPGKASPGRAGRAAEDDPPNMAPLPRGSRLLTGDVQEVQPLGLHGRPRGQRLPVPLHGRRRSARNSSVSLRLRLPARP